MVPLPGRAQVGAQVNAPATLDDRRAEVEALVAASREPGSVLGLLGMAFVEDLPVTGGVRVWHAEHAERGNEAMLIRHADASYSLSISRDGSAEAGIQRRTTRMTAWDCATPEDAASAWLVAASIEAPLLCGAVVDGMATTAVPS